MKYFAITMALFWLISYLILGYQIANSKQRISFLNILLMFLFPFLWVFFIKNINNIDVGNKKRYH